MHFWIDLVETKKTLFILGFFYFIFFTEKFGLKNPLKFLFFRLYTVKNRRISPVQRIGRVGRVFTHELEGRGFESHYEQENEDFFFQSQQKI